MTTAVKTSIVEGKSKRKRGLCSGGEESREGQKGRMSSEQLRTDQLIKLCKERKLNSKELERSELVSLLYDDDWRQNGAPAPAQDLDEGSCSLAAQNGPTLKSTAAGVEEVQLEEEKLQLEREKLSLEAKQLADWYQARAEQEKQHQHEQAEQEPQREHELDLAQVRSQGPRDPVSGASTRNTSSAGGIAAEILSRFKGVGISMPVSCDLNLGPPERLA